MREGSNLDKLLGYLFQKKRLHAYYNLLLFKYVYDAFYVTLCGTGMGDQRGRMEAFKNSTKKLTPIQMTRVNW